MNYHCRRCTGMDGEILLYATKQAKQKLEISRKKKLWKIEVEKKKKKKRTDWIC